LLVAGVVVWRAARAFWGAPTGWAPHAVGGSAVSSNGVENTDLLLGFLAAFIACLTVGLVDHYFFNPQFPQMAALLWTLAGALVALTHPAFGAASASGQRTLAGTRTAHDGRGAPRHGIHGTRRRAGADRDTL
jgi:hypothetical protein